MLTKGKFSKAPEANQNIIRGGERSRGFGVERESCRVGKFPNEMGQIVRKKKGRPAKVDPGERGTPPSEREPRRSNRRRSVKYTFELDDYFDELGLFEDDEDQQRREKELQLLLKVEGKGNGGGAQPESAGPKPGRPGRRVHHSASPSSSFSSEVDLPSKKRKMNEGIDDENGDASCEDDCNDNRVEVRERKSEFKAKILAPGPQTRAAPCGLPLPDKKTLELILNIIQRKDIYGVFAEPVDPEELPDYHGVIKNPMDFGTVKNKLSNGLYTTLEQIESDVYLICSNAMQYNAPDTIYYKQARGMHELAKRKFYELCLNSRSPEKESKYEQNIRSSSVLIRQGKSPVSQTVQDPVRSDFSYGATLEAAVDTHQVSNALLAVGSSRPCSVDRLAERNSFLNYNNLDKGEAILPGNGSLSKPCRKLSAHDENRRATYYNSLTHHLACSESLFSTFDGESKQLVPVGAYAEHSYVRSLARFAAALGPVSWKISSKRIEQALPEEVKYGRGWVGEYEPLSTPVLMLENCTVKEPPFFSKKLPDDPRKFEEITNVSISSKEILGAIPFLEKNPQSVGPAKIRPASAPITFPMKAQPDRENVSEVKASFFLAPCSKPSTSANLNRRHEKSGSKNAGGSEKQGLKQVELNGPPIFNKNVVDFIGQGHSSKGSEVEVSRSIFTSRNVNFTSSGSVKQPDIKEVAVGGLPNGKVVGDRIHSNTIASLYSNLAKGGVYYPQEQGQGLSDPVHLMRMLAEKAQSQQKSLYQSSPDVPHILSPDSNRNNLNTTTMTAVSHALRSVGASGFRPTGENTNPFKNQHANFLNISTRDMHSQGSRFREDSPASAIHSWSDRNNSPLNVFVSRGGPQPMRVGNDMHFQNKPMAFPPFPSNSKQMLESLPPDLNVGFQSPGSPGKNPSSGGLVESQQPDLALQL